MYKVAKLAPSSQVASKRGLTTNSFSNLSPLWREYNLEPITISHFLIWWSLQVFTIDSLENIAMVIALKLSIVLLNYPLSFSFILNTKSKKETLRIWPFKDGIRRKTYFLKIPCPHDQKISQKIFSFLLQLKMTMIFFPHTGYLTLTFL